MNSINRKIWTLCKNLKEQTTETVDNISVEFLKSGYKTDNTPPQNGWSVFEKGTKIGGCDEHYWFRGSFKTPATDGNHKYYLSIKTGMENQCDAINPQGLVYLNGKIVQGVDVNHTAVKLDSDTFYDMYIYFYIGMHESNVDFIADIICVDDRIEKLFYDISVPFNACECLDENSNDYVKMMGILEQTANIVSMREIKSDEYFKSIEKADRYINDNLYNGICGKSDVTISCIGHTHIDVAWMWTYAQTREKVQRSFATVLKLMKEYPEYVFMSSQPQLYEYAKESVPEVYEQIKELVKQGRWEVDGAMWLEADCNLISGESMVRQILFGKKFMLNEFNVDSRVLWLPDVFGYSASMPQILKKCGVDKFFTSKISWNDTNTMPNDTFMWEGIDGTEIFTSFLTAQELPADKKPVNYSSYVGMMNPSWIIGTWNRYRQKEYNNEALITFGYGDGGGGPTRDMLEQQRRMSFGLPGFPKTEIKKAGEFLERAEKNFQSNCKRTKRTPRWVGELYLEYHRGTYTSIAKNKKNNRKSEMLLQKSENISVANMIFNNSHYPKDEINCAWKKLLLNQFHDVIPGTSIAEVYEDSDKHYAYVEKLTDNIIDSALINISKSVKTDGGVLVYNSLSFPRNATINYGGKTLETGTICANGWKVISVPEDICNVKVCNKLIENQYYILKLDDSGRIISLFDKRYKREVFASGHLANEIQVFEDFPKDFDNWEISDYYKQKMWVADDTAVMEPVFDGNRAGIRIHKKYLKSTFVQTIYLYNSISRIDFETEVDWHENHQLVKVAFPLNIHATKATYEIQFGNIERPTHENTSWDKAKFEVCGHKWADISEYGYGVSLLNDCKYGYNTEGSTIKLTLIKCGTYPNPVADQGHHEFIYSLYPHGGSFTYGGTVKEAYSLNQPLEYIEVGKQNGTLPSELSVISCDCENIILDTIKKAEESDDIIVRLYNAFDSKTDAVIEVAFPFCKAILCDMLENEIKPIEVKNSKIHLPVSNFEIITLKIIR